MKIYLIAGSIRDVIHRLHLPLNEFPGFARRFGFKGIEVSDRQLIGEKDSALQDFAAACTKMKCGIILDVGCDLTLSSNRFLENQIGHARSMTRMANLLGAQGIRIWLGGQKISLQRLLFGIKTRIPSLEEAQNLSDRVSALVQQGLSSKPVTGIAHRFRKNMPSRVSGQEEKKIRAVSSLRRILENKDAEGLFFAVENHWGISARPESLLEVIHAVGSPWLGTCPDFANFPKDVDRFDALRKLAPHAFLAHAKLKGECRPMERDVDFRRCLTILKDCSFDGILSVEHDGPGDALSNCLTMRRLIRDFW